MEITGAGNIVTAVAVGAMVLGLTLFSAGIPPAEAVGSPNAQLSVSSSGIVTSETVGSHNIHVSISASGVVSAETIGVPGIAVGISASGIGTSEAAGAPQIVLAVAADGILPAGAVGAPEIVLVALGGGAVDVELNGIASGEAFGDVTVDLKAISVPISWGGGGYSRRAKAPARVPLYSLSSITISASGIKSGEKVGCPAITTNHEVNVAGIPTREIFGNPEIIIPAQVLIMKKRQEHDEITALLMAA